MSTVESTDGTKITYERHGDGPALILVDGALCTRTSGSKPELVSLLASQFTVFSYDRRGRGESGDASDGGLSPGGRAREICDIAALIAEAGGTAQLYGHSSGACLALEAALALGDRVTGIALYEPPYNDDPAVQRPWAAYLDELRSALDEGRGGDAVVLFMTYVGVPAEQIAGMRRSPSWAAFEAVGPSLAYDHLAVMGPDSTVPVARAAALPVPALVIYGDASFPFMGVTARALSDALPAGQLRVLAGQTHDVVPEVLAPVLVDFLTS